MGTRGPAYVPALDEPRLTQQHERIKALMLDGQWRSLKEISDRLDYPEASISAQLRHLRKERFGGYIVEKKRVSIQNLGTYVYRVLPPVPAGQLRLI